MAAGKGTSSGLRAFLPEPTSSTSSHIHIPVLLCVRFSPGLFLPKARVKKKNLWGIQWLGPCTFIAEDKGSALGQRTKIPQAMRSQKREVPSDADVSRQWGSVWDQIPSLAKSVGTGPSGGKQGHLYMVRGHAVAHHTLGPLVQAAVEWEALVLTVQVDAGDGVPLRPRLCAFHRELRDQLLVVLVERHKAEEVAHVVGSQHPRVHLSRALEQLVLVGAVLGPVGLLAVAEW